MAVRLHHSLLFRFGLLGAGLVLLGLVVRVATVVPFVQEQVQQLVAAQQMAIASYVARDIDSKIDSRLALIQVLAKDLPVAAIGKPDAIQDWLSRRQHLYPLFNSGLLLVPADGHGLLAEYPVLPGRGKLDYADRDWFREALRSDGAVIGRPYRGRANGDPLIVMAAAVRDAHGRALAVLAGVSVLDAGGFLDLLQETRVGETGGLLLVSPKDQLFVAASDPTMTLRPTPPAGVNPLHDQAMAGFRGTGVTVNARGVEELSAIAGVHATGWFVVARLPTAEAFRPAAALRGSIVQNSLAVLAGVLLILLLVVPRLLRPLTGTAREMRRMADGEAPLRPLPVVRPDEVGEVVAGFNYLLVKLQQQEASLRESEARLAVMAHHDALTGLPNRSMFEDRLEQALARADRNKRQVALLFCDLDGFKGVNDRYGHEAGDQVLCQAAQRLLDGRRQADTVARIGGDEFVVLLTDVEDGRKAARFVAEQCIDAVSRPFEVAGTAQEIGISIGIAIYPLADAGASNLLSRADAAMYRAKQAGKGRYAFCDAAEAAGELS
jgi:diguanylate cyclase (GGDEF)-like protein